MRATVAAPRMAPWPAPPAGLLEQRIPPPAEISSHELLERESGADMANLVVLGFDDRASAERVFQLVTDTLPKQQLLQVGDAALVWREQDGKPRIQQAVNTTAAGALGGAFWGTLIGLLFLNPLLGAAVGAGAGAIGGKLTDIGINDSMIKEMGQDLEPGKAAVFAL